MNEGECVTFFEPSGVLDTSTGCVAYSEGYNGVAGWSCSVTTPRRNGTGMQSIVLTGAPVSQQYGGNATFHHCGIGLGQFIQHGHGAECNLRTRVVSVSSGRHVVVFETTQEVDAGDELLVNYAPIADMPPPPSLCFDGFSDCGCAEEFLSSLHTAFVAKHTLCAYSICMG